MIQRIQSLFLALVAVVSLLMFFLPLAETAGYTLDALLITDITDKANIPVQVVYPITGLCIAVTILALLALAMFKKRQVQAKVCKLNFVVLAALLSSVFYYADVMATKGESIANYQMGTYMPIIALLLNFLALRAIKKDDDLVRSLDRLR